MTFEPDFVDQEIRQSMLHHVALIWKFRKTLPNTKYSQLSLNGHLYKTDTSIRRTPGAGPGHFLVILL